MRGKNVRRFAHMRVNPCTRRSDILKSVVSRIRAYQYSVVKTFRSRDKLPFGLSQHHKALTFRSALKERIGFAQP